MSPTSEVLHLTRHRLNQPLMSCFTHTSPCSSSLVAAAPHMPKSSPQPLGPSHPIITYQGLPHPTILEAEVPSNHSDSSAPPSPLAPDLPDPSTNLPIALRKSKPFYL